MTHVFSEAVVAGLLFTVLMIHSLEATAQPYVLKTGPQYTELGLYVSEIRPEGEFGDVLDEKTHDVGFYASITPTTLPVRLGFEIDYGIYGSKGFTESLLNAAPEWDVKIRRYNKLFRGALVAKLQPTWWRILPHIDAAVGLQRLWTNTEVTDSDTHETLKNKLIMSDITPIIGVGYGIGFVFFTYETYEYILDLSARHTFGGKATYLTRGDYKVHNDGSVTINENRTRTDVVEYRFTISVRY